MFSVEEHTGTRSRPIQTKANTHVEHSLSDSSEFETSQHWMASLQGIYGEAVIRYEHGVRGADDVIPENGLAFLASIGTTAQEIYDFVEDWSEVGEPPFSTVAAITAVRREYFLTVQHRQPSTQTILPSTLPSGSAELGGYRWLPRIITKARAKLRGEMSPEFMYGCGADRPFLRAVGIDPAAFLQIVWQAESNDQVILDAVRFYSRTYPHGQKLIQGT
jgi:hypothetical protein